MGIWREIGLSRATHDHGERDISREREKRPSLDGRCQIFTHRMSSLLFWSYLNSRKWRKDGETDPRQLVGEIFYMWAMECVSSKDTVHTVRQDRSRCVRALHSHTARTALWFPWSWPYFKWWFIIQLQIMIQYKIENHLLYYMIVHPSKRFSPFIPTHSF